MADTVVLEKEQPLYLQLKEILKNRIKSGELKHGDKMPSLRKLCTEYQVSDITVRRTMKELVHEGHIYSEHGKGTFIATRERKNHTVSSKRLALLLPSITEHVFPEILRGAEDVCHDRGYSLTVCNTDNDPKKQIKYLHKMDQEHIDGLIITPIKWHPVALEHYECLLVDKIPFVFVVRFLPEFNNVDHIVTDNILGGYLATSHLIKLGHTRIGFVSAAKHIISEERFAGYKKALNEANVSIEERLIKFGGMSDEKVGDEVIKELLNEDIRPTAIFAYNDKISKEVYETAVEEGLKVPEDLALVGFDDSGIDRFMPISLTTVASPSYETGALGAKILLDRIEGKNFPIQYHVLKPKLVIRESCGAKLRK